MPHKVIITHFTEEHIINWLLTHITLPHYYGVSSIFSIYINKTHIYWQIMVSLISFLGNLIFRVYLCWQREVADDRRGKRKFI